MKNSNLTNARARVRAASRLTEEVVLKNLVDRSEMTTNERLSAQQAASDLVTRIRSNDNPGLMEIFLAQYGLSTDEGIALMCLAEALLRVPDNKTIDDLIEDKIVPSSWGTHLGQSSSSLVNAATWGLLFTGKVLDANEKDTISISLHGAIKRLGEPLIRKAVKRAMKEMGRQFVLGESIEAAVARGQKQVDKGFSYSFDMLGEAALTETDARGYFLAYERAIETISLSAHSDDCRDNPGISIKLSALHPRYSEDQHDRVLSELVPTVLKLTKLAQRSNIGLNIDAEEADRLDLSLAVIQSVFADPSLSGWDGFGVVVQAYNRRASDVLDWLYALAEQYDRRIMVRLVKGAYWDSEIKRAQVAGLSEYPVFTRKAFTDISYLCCAKQLLSMADRIYPQFATHNAQTVAAVMAIAGASNSYEFQRLHGMGEALYEMLVGEGKVRCRIYAPVGKHRDLLAYLVRRLLENGANSSFVNQIVDLDVPVEEVIADPFTALEKNLPTRISQPRDLFKPDRENAKGWALYDFHERNDFNTARESCAKRTWQATPLLATAFKSNQALKIINPADSGDIVGEVIEANEQDIDAALRGAKPWANTTAQERADVLLKAASLFEENTGEIAAILAREAGKTPHDVVAEIREAVDFLRYYAVQAKVLGAQARGIFICISPWNFPLAIFAGQVSAALATGNGVLAKPAESTPLIAFFATQLFHQAGVPREVLQLLTGEGATVGAQLVAAKKIDGVCFTGSTATALRINRSMAEHMAAEVPLIAETGGLNAMIVDSTALPEQAVSDIVRSAFTSAGQRCSALRILYIQEFVYDQVLEMLCGAIDELSIGNPWLLATDLGPLISKNAQQSIQDYIDAAAAQGRLIKTLAKDTSGAGNFVKPSVIAVSGIADLSSEIFGPVLHVAKFRSGTINKVVDDLNAAGYGLTFGLHTRIDSRIEGVINSLNVGNIYINRDQIGAVVGSQPFGGENLSGTGPKAGGPHYLSTFTQANRPQPQATLKAPKVTAALVQSALNSLGSQCMKLSEREMPGPTGESNKLYEYARGVVLCLGADFQSAKEQAKVATDNGCESLIVCPGASGDNTIDGYLPRELLAELTGFKVVALWSEQSDLVQARQALARRAGLIVPLVCDDGLASACRLERHVCVDTTAAGGNVSLLAMTK